MKSLFFKPVLWSFLFLSSIVLSLSSCTKDDNPASLKEELVGSWQVTSNYINGNEVFGVLFFSSTLKFDAYSGAFGTAVITSEDYNHMIQVHNWTYVLNETTKDLTMTDKNGKIADYKLSITGDELDISGTYNTQTTIIKATKK